MRGAYCPNLSRCESYEEARAEFRLIASDGINTAREVCDGHSGSVLQPAVIEVRSGGENVYTFGALDYLSDKLARVLTGSSVGRGDRVAVLLDQSAALVVALLAAWKTGAFVVPLSVQSETRPAIDLMEIASPKAAILQDPCDPNLAQSLRGMVPSIFIVSDDAYNFIPAPGERNFWKEVYAASSEFEPAAGLSEPHAFLFRVRVAENAL